MNTLDRLDSMAVEWVLPGHGETVPDLPERIGEMRNHHERRLQLILDSLREPMTPYNLAQGIYSGLAGWNIFLAVAEICAHLDLLAERGLVREEVAGEPCVHVYRRK